MKCKDCNAIEFDRHGRAYCDLLANWGRGTFYIDEHPDNECDFEQAIKERDERNKYKRKKRPEQ